MRRGLAALNAGLLSWGQCLTKPIGVDLELYHAR